MLQVTIRRLLFDDLLFVGDKTKL